MPGPRVAATNWFRLVNVASPVALAGRPNAPRPLPRPRLVKGAKKPAPAPVLPPPGTVLWSNRVAA